MERAEHVDGIAKHDDQPGVGIERPDIRNGLAGVEIPYRPLAECLDAFGGGLKELQIVFGAFDLASGGQVEGEVSGLLVPADEDLGVFSQVFAKCGRAGLQRADYKEVGDRQVKALDRAKLLFPFGCRVAGVPLPAGVRRR